MNMKRVTGPTLQIFFSSELSERSRFDQHSTAFYLYLVINLAESALYIVSPPA